MPKTPKTKVKIDTREFTISYDNFESAIVSWLYAVGAIPKDLEVVSSDFGIPIDENDLIKFDLTLIPMNHQYELNV